MAARIRKIRSTMKRNLAKFGRDNPPSPGEVVFLAIHGHIPFTQEMSDGLLAMNPFLRSFDAPLSRRRNYRLSKIDGK